MEVIMKKKGCFVTAAVLLASIFAISGCNAGQNAPNIGTETTASPTESVSVTTEKTDEAAAETSAKEEVTTERTTQKESDPVGDDATIEETVLVDEKDVKITATGISYSDYDVEISLIIENNSDQELSFLTGSMSHSINSVNGYMISDGYVNADVSAGKKSNEKMSISRRELALVGITQIADIEISFLIEDEDNDEYLVTKPAQIKTSAFDSHDYSKDYYLQALSDGTFGADYDVTIDSLSEEKLFDDSGISLVSQAYVTNSSDETMLMLEFENTSDQQIYVGVKNISVSGLNVYSSLWASQTITPGKRGIIGIVPSDTVDDYVWEAFGIDSFTDVGFSLVGTDEQDNKLFESEEINVISGDSTAANVNGTEIYNEDGIKVVCKGIFPDPSDYSEDIHILFYAENGYSKDIQIDADYNSVYVNDFSNDFICYGAEIPSGGNSVFELTLWDSSLEDNGITDVSDITSVEMELQIRDSNYNDIAQSTVSIDF